PTRRSSDLFGLRFEEAARRMERCLQEFRVRGVKTNIPFLLNLVTNPDFLGGRVTTRFIDETPALLHLATRRDRATKLLVYLGEMIVNRAESPAPLSGDAATRVGERSAPLADSRRGVAGGGIPPGTRDKLRELGPERFATWLREQKRLLITDTTMRDAHH